MRTKEDLGLDFDRLGREWKKGILSRGTAQVKEHWRTLSAGDSYL